MNIFPGVWLSKGEACNQEAIIQVLSQSDAQPKSNLVYLIKLTTKFNDYEKPFVSSEPETATAGSIMFSGCPSHSWERDIS